MAGTAQSNSPPVIFFAFAAEAVPGHGELLRLADEQRQLRALLDPLVRAGRCELVERPALTPDDLFAVFQDERWRHRIAAFHFAGHADGYSLLMQNSAGKALLLGADGLAEFLACRKGLQLVFLNACSTLAQAEGLHAAGVPAVIATSEDIDDDLALRFAVHFYRGLAGGASIGEAYGEAQGALRAEVFAKRETLDPSLWVLSAEDAAKGWCLPPAAKPRPDPNVPLQKPLRVQHFTGRQEELAQLLENLQPGKVVTLCGPGGMGKSALAAEAVWTLAPGDEPPARFPDGILFHTFYHQPQASLALEKIARAYGIDPRPSPRDAAQQALASKSALLILDGAEEADDLPAVLAVSGNCGVLITTRRHADAPDDVQDVEPLPRAESLALLRAWAGRYAVNDAAVNDIVRLLGGLPLALYLCGRYLAQRHQHAGEYVAWLKGEELEALHFGERPTKSIPLLLRRSLEQVSEQAQLAFGVAGILALAPFAADAVAAALDINAGAANRALGELVDYGLLLRPDDSYQVTHALAHSYARTQAAPSADVVNCLAMYYAAMAETECAKGLGGYATLDQQRAHIVAVQAAALKVEQWDAVREITWTIEDYLDVRGYYTDRQTVVQAGLTAACASGARYDQVEFLNRLGLNYADLGELRRAIDLYEQQLVIALEIGDRIGEGTALGNMGNAYKSLGEIRRAIEYQERCLAIAREIGDRRIEGAALCNLGLAYADLGETRRAIDLYEQRLVIVREIGDRRGEGGALGNLGLAYAVLGETRRAIEYQEQYLAIAREIGDRNGEGTALGSLGNAYAELGETPRAIDLYEQQLVIVREIGDRHGEGTALGSLGNAYADLGETHRAIDFYEQAMVTLREIGSRRSEALVAWNLGLAYRQDNDFAQAIANMLIYVDYLQESGHPDAIYYAQRVDELRSRLATSS